MTSSELIPPKSRRLDAGSVALAVAALVAIGGLAFAAGRLTAPAAASAGGFRNATGGTTAGGIGGGTESGLGTTGGTGGTGQAPTSSFVPGAGAGGFRGGFGGAAFGAGGGLTVSGTVTAVSSSSITLKLASGTTIDIPIDSSTTYHSQTAATAADVKVGGQVDVELAGGAGGTRDFSGAPAASPAAGSGSAANRSGPAASGTPASPNPGDLLSRLGSARSITVVGP